MAGRIALPQRFQQLTETAQKPDTSYYRWFESVEVTLRDLDGRVTVLEAASGGGGASFIMQGPLSVEVLGTPAGGLVQLQLDGDVSAPGSGFYYGTNGVGAKGWYSNASTIAQGAGIALTTAGTGVTTIAHADTSSVTNVNSTNANGVAIQSFVQTYDTFGHVLTSTVATVDFDARYGAALATGGTTAQFWRGDKSWSNTLAGPFTANGRITATAGSLAQSGTVTGEVRLLELTGPLQNSNTTQQQVIQAQPAIAPQGATLADLFGLIFVPSLNGGATAITRITNVFARCDSTAGFTGTVGMITGFRAAAPAGPLVTVDYVAFRADDTSVGSGTNRALDAMLNAGTGKHNVYARGTAPNYFRGNVGVNTQNQFGSGDGVIGIGNAVTLPTTNPVAGVVIYADAGAAKCRGSSGTVTTFGPAAPHCHTCGSDFVHEWENETRGYGYLAVCMSCYADGVRSFTRTKGQWTE